MKIVSMLQTAVLLASMSSQAATVEYRHPDLTIVARAEPLADVLKSVGKEMRIFITVPTGFNPIVNCDIQAQPVSRALQTLLRDASYSLVWEEGGERLAGITILAGGPGSSIANAPRGNAPSQAVAAPAVTYSTDESGAAVSLQSRLAAERAEQEESMKEEEVARHDAEHEAELEAFLQSKGAPMMLP